MKRIALPLALLLAAPLAAQTPEAPGQAPAEPPGLIERGLELMLRGLFEDVAPAMRDMEGQLRDLQPELQRLLDLIGDFRNYEAPERLPNGDIVIRRKADAPPPAPETEPQAPDGAVDL